LTEALRFQLGSRNLIKTSRAAKCSFFIFWGGKTRFLLSGNVSPRGGDQLGEERRLASGRDLTSDLESCVFFGFFWCFFKVKVFSPLMAR